MRLFFRLSFLIGLNAVIVPLVSADQKSDQVDALFQQFDGNVPGASVLIVQDDQIQYAKGYGLARLADHRPVDPSTNFRLASLTKQFTAMAIMILHDRGLLSYADPIRKYLPELPSYADHISVRHLLNHQGGLMDYEDLIPGDQSAQVRDLDVLRLIARQRSTYFTPGSQYRYSNGGYVLLGIIVARVSGQSFAQFLQENVFTPTGMTHSVAFEDGISTVDNRAYGNSPSGGRFVETDQSSTSATLGDGGVYTSANDLFRWDQALEHITLVKPETLREAWTPGKLNDGSLTSYGFGWMLNSYRGLHRYYHTGSSIGFRTSIHRYPDKHFTVAVLCNRANSAPWTIGDQITDIYLFNGIKSTNPEETPSYVTQ